MGAQGDDLVAQEGQLGSQKGQMRARMNCLGLYLKTGEGHLKWPMAAQGKSHGGLRRFRGEMVISYVMYGRIIPLIRNRRS